MELISIDDLKTFLDLENNDSHTKLLGSIIKQVSSRFERYTNRNFEKTERTKVFDGNRKLYFVDALPIDTAQTIAVTVNSVAKTKDEDFWVYDTAGYFRFLDYTTDLPQTVSITYTGGYAKVGVNSDVLDVPDDLKQACILQSAMIFKRRKDIGLSSVSLPDGSINTNNPTNLLPLVKQTLNQYKLHRL